jgi:hypothetical protein
VALLYSNENFPFPVVEELRQFGHDVVTLGDQEKAGEAHSDVTVLAWATSMGRAVLTLNRRDFIRLHMSQPQHAGILSAPWIRISKDKPREFTWQFKQSLNCRGNSFA